MASNNSVRNEIKQVAKIIEKLAQQVQTNLDQGADVIPVANELARNSSTFVFTLGALYASEQLGVSGGKRTVKTTMVSNPNKTRYSNFHNKRDASGRFIRS